MSEPPAAPKASSAPRPSDGADDLSAFGERLARARDLLDAGEAASRSAAGEVLAQLAVELERWAALERAERRRHERLAAVLPELDALRDLDDIAVTVSRLVREFVQHDAAGVLVLHSGGGHVHGLLDGRQRLSTEASPDFIDSQFRALASRDALRVRDLEVIDEASLIVRQHLADDAEGAYRDVVVPEGALRSLQAIGARSELRAAIRQGSELAGVLLLSSRRPDHFTAVDETVLRRFAERVSLRLARERLEEERRRASEAAERSRDLEQRVDRLSEELERYTAHRALGQSAAWKQALAQATQVAATETTVLITGESGTGKEVVARFIHRGSPRAGGPFVALNCAALPEQLLESELFGHERGAFTGALQSRPGKIEQAAGGVLFLDEVGEMSPAVQAKFLRVLQEREYQRLGSSKTLRADARVVAATNRDPRRAMETGALREDLYYRLSVFEIHLPPLRERPEDVLVLADAFLDEVGASIGRPAAGISEDARGQLLAHAWPGNVRELKNAIERAVILCHGGLLTREHLPGSVSRAPAARGETAAAPSEPSAGDLRLDAAERTLLSRALERSRDNKSEAARLLGLSRGQLYSLMRRHGLTDAKR
jgi:transcriptional regulator with GAF, ATPase, and Fis domain